MTQEMSLALVWVASCLFVWTVWFSRREKWESHADHLWLVMPVVFGPFAAILFFVFESALFAPKEKPLGGGFAFTDRNSYSTDVTETQ